MEINKNLELAAAVALVVACGALGYGIAAYATDGGAPQTARLVKVSARRFEFVPNNITLRKGETIDIELVSEDVVMGFNAPDLAVRANILPGTATHVQLTATRVGTFNFLCDVFCGSGHEDMNGTITVTD